MKQALVCGYYGHYNLGDEAMLAGLLSLLRQWRPDVATTVYSNHPADTHRRHSVQTWCSRPPRRRLERWQQQVLPYWLLLRHRWFVLGGGDLLRDGPLNAAGQSVAEVWLQPLQQAIRLHCQTLVWGVSVGQLWRPRTQDRIRTVLNQTGLIAVRDRTSQTTLQALGVHRPIVVMPDLALYAPNALNIRAHAERDSLQIGLSVRSLAQRGSAASDSAPGSDPFIGTMAALVDRLASQYNAHIHLLPLQSFPEDYRQRHRPAVDDLYTSQAVLDRCQHAARVTLHPYFPTLTALNHQLSQMDLVIGTRLHALILAARLGIPVVAAAYDPKVDAFMAEIDQTAWSIPTAQFSMAQALPAVEQILADGPAARHCIRNGIQRYQQRFQPGLEQVQRFWQA